MCVIVYKPTNTNEPDEQILKRCFNHNRDGAGYMLVHGGQVVIRKGFMSFDEFYNDYARYVLENRIDTFNTPIVYHFRITTQGGIQRELCHPYPVCTSYDTMRMLKHTCDMAIAHNGIITLTSRYSKVQLPFNDTMTFIKDYASLIIGKDLFFAKNKNKCMLMERMINGSKLAIMNKYGYVKLIGNFELIDGIYYSNTHMFQTHTIKHWDALVDDNGVIDENEWFREMKLNGLTD